MIEEKCLRMSKVMNPLFFPKISELPYSQWHRSIGLFAFQSDPVQPFPLRIPSANLAVDPHSQMAALWGKWLDPAGRSFDIVLQRSERSTCCHLHNTNEWKTTGIRWKTWQNISKYWWEQYESQYFLPVFYASHNKSIFVWKRFGTFTLHRNTQKEF